MRFRFVVDWKSAAEFRLVVTDTHDILFIECLKNYVAIHTATQKIVSLQRLRTLEDQLPADKFIRSAPLLYRGKKRHFQRKRERNPSGGREDPIGDTYSKLFMDFISGRHLH